MEKFTKQIYADDDAYYMSCPEFVSDYLATRLSNFSTAMELCSAVGISVICLAKKLKYVLGIEINSKRIEDAKKNAKLYNVKNVEFINGDVLDETLLKKYDVDVAILDPDWSVDKKEPKIHSDSLESTKPNAITLFNLVKKNLTDKIVLRVSKNVTREDLTSLGPCAIENIIYNDKLKFKYAFYGFDEEYERDIIFDELGKISKIERND